ncbi:hypothetical protein D3C72_1362540 [compost metagenome]
MVAFDDKLVGQRIPRDLIDRVAGEVQLIENLFASLRLQILAHGVFVRTLRDQRIFAVTVQFEVVDFFVPRHRRIKV